MGRQRLQKILAAAGIASRRAAEELIRAGRVSVDGAPAQKIAMVSPRLRSRAGRSARARRVAATSHGLPMKTHGEGACSTRSRRSAGLAGA